MVVVVVDDGVEREGDAAGCCPSGQRESYKPSNDEFKEEFSDASSVTEEFNEPFSEVSNGRLLLFVTRSPAGSWLGVPLITMKFSELSCDCCCCRNFPCFRMAAIRLFASRFTLSSLRPFFVDFFRGLPLGEEVVDVFDFTRVFGELLF